MSALWIILIAALVAGSGAILGSFLVLRRLAMLGDAVSHAVLPGIVLAFMLTNSRASVPMFLGAAAVGVLTSVIVQALSRGGVQGDAAIGVTFTALFALGVVMVARFADRVDLDLDCVLMGEIIFAPFDTLTVGGVALGPRAAWVNGALLLLNLAVVYSFYKELKLCAFDPALAASQGIRVNFFHYLLMGLVSVTTVGAFESVGAILVVALLVVPAATAYLLTDRLARMLAIAVGVGVLSSAVGYLLARTLDASVAGSIAAVAGGLFTLALLFSPSHGVVVKRVTQARLRRRVAEEDLLLWAGREQEKLGSHRFSPRDASLGMERLLSETEGTVRRLLERGLVVETDGTFRLSAIGMDRATELLRRHRVYESYLGELGYPVDHLHAAADRVEHHLDAALIDAVDAAASRPTHDPQGKPIPPLPER